MRSDIIRAADVVSTGNLVASGAGRLRGLYVRTTGTEGTVVFNGTAGGSGAEMFTLNTPAVEGHQYIGLPGDGIPFAAGMHVTLSNVDGVTAFYAAETTL
jgi:hypothetical protein